MTDVAPVVKEKRKNPKRLSVKQKGFISDVVDGLAPTEAAKRNYDTSSDNSAAAIASQNLSKPAILHALADAIPDDLVREKHLALLNKMETIEETDPNTKKKVLRRTKEINAPAVAKALELAYKVKGAFIDPIESPAKSGNTYNFFYKPEIKATTDEYEEKLKKLLYESNAEGN